MASADISPGFYTLEIDKTKWEVRKKYQLVQPLGVGAYGHVVSFLDTSENVTRAIKKLMRPFLSTIHAKRTYRELRLLKHMHHENVISLLDVFTPQTSLETLEDVYLVTNLMGKDLNNIVKTQKLTDDHVQFMMYQILRGLKYIHSAGILHKILDFGLAQHEVGEVTGYVPTRWYKAPEIAFNWMSYSQTGSDDMDQLLRTLNLRGTPFSKIIDKIENAKAKDQIASLPIMEKKPLKEIFIGANPKALDLLDLMLDLDAEQRVNAEAALAHPYLEHYADSNDEPTAEKFDETFENLEMEISEWKKLVYDEVQSFKHVTPASDD